MHLKPSKHSRHTGSYPISCLNSLERHLATEAGVGEGLSASPVAINVRNLGLSVNGDKGKVVVLKECSLTVPEGQLWMLLGPNGCGKSTLLKASFRTH